MSLWRELILNYHTSCKIKTLVVHDCPLWKNADIQRELDRKGIERVMDDFVKRCDQSKANIPHASLSHFLSTMYFHWYKITWKIGSGHGEWENDTKTRCRILWRKPEQLASDIYDWADANGYINSVCTVYELHSGKLNINWSIITYIEHYLIFSKHLSILKVRMLMECHFREQTRTY